MRAAPAVQTVLAPDALWRWLMRALAATTLAGLTAWALSWAGASDPVIALAAAAAALAGAAIGPRLMAAPAGVLRWDGTVWSWQPQGSELAQTGALAVMIDLGPWMLLRLQPAGARAVWLPLSQTACGPAWRALRTAAHARGAPE